MRMRALLRGSLAAFAFASFSAAASECVPVGTWVRPHDRSVIAKDAVLAVAARAQVVLLGERHAHAPHQRWQLDMLRALHARHPQMVVGFEMFPRRVQPALDRWVAGETDVDTFIRESDWDKVWRYDFELYRPLFEYARAERLPMRALNVEQSLVRATGAKGFDAVPPADREGVSAPAEAPRAYVTQLREVYAEHARSADEAAFRRFIEAQLLWDRAMAQGIAETLHAHPDAIVIGIMGRGHVQHGHGVPHQLADLGVERVVSLLPWSADDNCADLAPDIADAVYGVESGKVPVAGEPSR